MGATRYLCVSLKLRPSRLGEMMILPLQEFLAALWRGTYAA